MDVEDIQFCLLNMIFISWSEMENIRVWPRMVYTYLSLHE